MGSSRDRWPSWVRLTLLGVPTRGAAMMWFWLAIVTATSCVAAAFAYPPAALGGLMALAAAWYHFAIRWVDRHSRW